MSRVNQATATNKAADKGDVPSEFLADPGRYFLEWIPKQLDERRPLPDRFQRADDVVQIQLTGQRGGAWHVVFGRGDIAIHSGQVAKPSFTVTMSVPTWRGLTQGQINGFSAYIKGHIEIKGSRRAFFRVARLFR